MKNFIDNNIIPILLTSFILSLIIIPHFYIQSQYNKLKNENFNSPTIDTILDKKWRILHTNIENNLNGEKVLFSDKTFLDYCNTFGFETIHFSSNNNTFTTDLTKCINKINKTYNGNWHKLSDSTFILKFYEKNYKVLIKNTSYNKATIKIINEKYSINLEMVKIK